MKSDFADFFQNFTEVNAQSVLTIGTLKVLKNHAWNEIIIFRNFYCEKLRKSAKNLASRFFPKFHKS